MRRGSEFSLNMKADDSIEAKVSHNPSRYSANVMLSIDVEGDDHTSSLSLYVDSYTPELLARFELIAATINNAGDLADPEHARGSRQQLKAMIDRHGYGDSVLEALTEAYELGRAAERAKAPA